MDRKLRPPPTRRKGGGAGLAQLPPEEGIRVLRLLLALHPELVAQAEEIAKSAIANVNAEDVAEDGEQAILGIDMDDVAARAGRKSWGYVEPDEAMCELLEEVLDPFIETMRSCIALGSEQAATPTGHGSGA